MIVVCNYAMETYMLHSRNMTYEEIQYKMSNMLYITLIVTFLIAISAFLLNCVINLCKQIIRENLTKEMTYLMGSNIILCTIIFMVNEWAGREIGYSKEVLKINLLLFSVYAIFTIVVSLIIFKIFHERKKMEYEKKQQESMMEYTKQIEIMNMNLRTFKHDYVNILVAMSGYFESNDLEGLKEYFYKDILPTNTKMNKSDYRLNQLSKIKNQALKGLLASKLIYAHELGIEVDIDILHEIDQIDMNVIDITRVMGIYLDNATEAASECEQKEIKCNFIKDKDKIIITVANTYCNETLDLRRISECGYSTKGENRGLGLYNEGEILKNYTNVEKLTECSQGYFWQRLMIRNKISNN